MHNLNETVVLLAHTPDVLNALLRGLPDRWTMSNEGGGTWTPPQVVAHLIHAERENWIPRARVILEWGLAKPFPSFDREGSFRELSSRNLEELLDEFTRARTASLQELSAMDLSPIDLNKRGTHPALGTVTLSELLATWAAHDLMAVQYREDVGPWSKFLGVMQCAGHSA